MSNTTVTDRIVFRMHAGTRQGSKAYPWYGQWPPPSQLAVIVETSTDKYKVVELDKQEPGHVERLLGAGLIELNRFQLHSATEQLEPAPPGADWCRVAEYIPRTT